MNNFEHENLIPSERQSLIFEIIKKKKAVSVQGLSKELFINEATIRRDLNMLAKSGMVSRTHGGAVLNEGPDSEIPFFIRQTAHEKEKRQIGETAAEFIKNGDTVFIDSSSTASFVIPHITQKNGLKIMTNGAKAAIMLSSLYNCEIFCTGGKLRENSLSFIGDSALSQLKNFHFDSVFFSCRGIDLEYGLTDPDINEAAIRKTVIGNSAKSFLLADSSKFGTVSFCKISALENITAVITDNLPDRIWKERLSECGVSVYY